MTSAARQRQPKNRITSSYPRTSFALLSLLVAATARADNQVGGAPPPAITISIVGTNDLHGHIEALPRLGGYLANLRAARARDGGGVVLLDAGDMFQGTLESNLNEGAAVVRAYNALAYDAAAVGNHEFDFGPVGPATAPRGPGDDPRGALKARAAEARFPFLAANLFDAATGAPPAWPNFAGTKLIERAGLKIGMIGLANAGTAFITLPANFAGLRALPLAPVVVDAAKDLRHRGAHAVVVVAHVGGSCGRVDADNDLASCKSDSEIFDLARALPAGTVDAIVAGHTHAGIAHRVAGVPIIEAYDKGPASGASICRSTVRATAPRRRSFRRSRYRNRTVRSAVHMKARRWRPIPRWRRRARRRSPPRAPRARRAWASRSPLPSCPRTTPNRRWATCSPISCGRHARRPMWR